MTLQRIKTVVITLWLSYQPGLPLRSFTSSLRIYASAPDSSKTTTAISFVKTGTGVFDFGDRDEMVLNLGHRNPEMKRHEIRVVINEIYMKRYQIETV